MTIQKEIQHESLRLTDSLLECHIPDYMWDGIADYILRGTPPGSFLRAVITNNLKEAAFQADDTNRNLLYNYATLFYWHAPSNCWGTTENYNEWTTVGGLQGYLAAIQVANLQVANLDQPEPGWVMTDEQAKALNKALEEN